ncbi:MAG: hypothetical protein MRY32_00465 [Rickettsiales bacterium]|nr:hypothetical protein [Rickettsiales bacterium]
MIDELTRHTDQYLKFAISFIGEMTLSEFEQMDEPETSTERRYQIYHALRDDAYKMAIKELRSKLPDDPREQQSPAPRVTTSESALEVLELAENRNEIHL